MFRGFVCTGDSRRRKFADIKDLEGKRGDACVILIIFLLPSYNHDGAVIYTVVVVYCTVGVVNCCVAVVTMHKAVNRNKYMLAVIYGQT